MSSSCGNWSIRASRRKRSKMSLSSTKSCKSCKVQLAWSSLISICSKAMPSCRTTSRSLEVLSRRGQTVALRLLARPGSLACGPRPNSSYGRRQCCSLRRISSQSLFLGKHDEDERYIMASTTIAGNAVPLAKGIGLRIRGRGKKRSARSLKPP